MGGRVNSGRGKGSLAFWSPFGGQLACRPAGLSGPHHDGGVVLTLAGEGVERSMPRSKAAPTFHRAPSCAAEWGGSAAREHAARVAAPGWRRCLTVWGCKEDAGLLLVHRGYCPTAAACLCGGRRSLAASCELSGGEGARIQNAVRVGLDGDMRRGAACERGKAKTRRQRSPCDCYSVLLLNTGLELSVQNSTFGPKPNARRAARHVAPPPGAAQRNARHNELHMSCQLKHLPAHPHSPPPPPSAPPCAPATAPFSLRKQWKHTRQGRCLSHER